MINHLYFNKESIGETIRSVRSDYIEQCIDTKGKCGFEGATGEDSNYWLYKNFFIFVYYGDPSQFDQDFQN